MDNFAKLTYYNLGVAHLAHSLVKRVHDKQPELKVEKDLECVTLAALCHDLGTLVNLEQIINPPF